ncbi:MAG: hypothetical protein MJ252_02785 [archaeon]|nr:hypothetical protein [archaeon]
MSDQPISCRFTKVKNNRLLSRVQMIVDVFHAPQVKVTKNMIMEEVKKKFKKNHISIFGLKKLYGGGRTKCFALVYDSEDALKKVEPAYRQRKAELEKLPPDQRKENKPKKDGRKVLKVKKNQNARKRATKRRQEQNLKRKQNKKK